MNPSPAITTRIETTRLYLRSYQPTDADWYAAMCQKNQPHLTLYESGNAAFSIHNAADAEKTIREFAASWAEGRAFFLGAFRQDTDEFVAQIYIGLSDASLPEYELGYFADVNHQGQGYVSEAACAALGFIFNRLGAYRVRLECNDANERSCRVAERCGMMKEGHIRQNNKRPNGEINGTMLYGLLRSEFSANG